jgi:excisionase family DNA binding protein
METLYSINEAAKKLGGISRHTVTLWLSQGKLQRTKVGRRTMIAESELQRVLNVGGISPAPSQRRRTPAQDAPAAAVQTESAVA